MSEEFKVVDGVLCVRATPRSKWMQLSKQALTDRILGLQKVLEINRCCRGEGQDEDKVSQLNDWAIAAFSAIEAITGEAAFSGLPESKQNELSRLVGES